MSVLYFITLSNNVISLSHTFFQHNIPHNNIIVQSPNIIITAPGIDVLMIIIVVTKIINVERLKQKLSPLDYSTYNVVKT